MSEDQIADTPPDHLSADPRSPFYDEEVLRRDVGIRINGVEKTNVQEYDVAEGDVLLLCSDGLTEMVGSHEMAGLLNACQPDLAEAARRLIDMANEAGGRDNISVVLVQVLPSVAGQPSN